jgi:hypothetical protein
MKFPNARCFVQFCDIDSSGRKTVGAIIARCEQDLHQMHRKLRNFTPDAIPNIVRSHEHSDFDSQLQTVVRGSDFIADMTQGVSDDTNG